MIITSFQNPTIKFIQSLEKPRERRDSGLFVFEGIKELSLAIEGQFELDKIIYSSSLILREEIERMIQGQSVELIEVSKEIFNHLVYRKDIANVLVLAKQKKHDFAQVDLPEDALIAVIEGIEKPGNMGAILRTADAAGVDAVIIADGKTDIYNPNVIRSSVGCVFTMPILQASSVDALNFLQKNKFNIFTTYLFTDHYYYQSNFKGKTAIVFGSEDRGVTDIWLEESIMKIKIPMHGKIDSMNVSNSAAILLFEAVRQRTKI